VIRKRENKRCAFLDHLQRERKEKKRKKGKGGNRFRKMIARRGEGGARGFIICKPLNCEEKGPAVH